MTLSIRTNNHWREPVPFYELPESVRSDFDYVDEEEQYSDRFVCYRGFWYDLHEFFRIHAGSQHDPHALRPAPESPLFAWTGYQSDSFFSGIVIRYNDDFEQVQIGTYSS